MHILIHLYFINTLPLLWKDNCVENYLFTNSLTSSTMQLIIVFAVDKQENLIRSENASVWMTVNEKRYFS